MIANDARTMVYDTLYKYEYDIPQELEDKINEDGFYSCTKEGCPDFDEEKGTFLECLLFKRDYGSVKEQRREVLKYVNSLKKEVIKKVLGGSQK